MLPISRDSFSSAPTPALLSVPEETFRFEV